MTEAPENLEELAAGVLEALPTLRPAEQRLALELYRLLAEGAPVRRERLAAALEVPIREVTMLLEGAPLASLVHYDDDRQVVGFGGLAVVPMLHRFRVDGRLLYTWCAWDSLFIPEMLGRAAAVESRCPATTRTLHLEVSPEGVRSVDPDGVVMSFLRPDADVFSGDTRQTIASFCHYIHYLASPEAAAGWTATHPGTFVLTLEQAFELGRRKNAGQFAEVLVRGAGGRSNAGGTGSGARSVPREKR